MYFPHIYEKYTVVTKKNWVNFTNVTKNKIVTEAGKKATQNNVSSIWVQLNAYLRRWCEVVLPEVTSVT